MKPPKQLFDRPALREKLKAGRQGFDPESDRATFLLRRADAAAEEFIARAKKLAPVIAAELAANQGSERPLMEAPPLTDAQSQLRQFDAVLRQLAPALEPLVRWEPGASLNHREWLFARCLTRLWAAAGRKQPGGVRVARIAAFLGLDPIPPNGEFQNAAWRWDKELRRARDEPLPPVLEELVEAAVAELLAGNADRPSERTEG